MDLFCQRIRCVLGGQERKKKKKRVLMEGLFTPSALLLQCPPRYLGLAATCSLGVWSLTWGTRLSSTARSHTYVRIRCEAAI